MDRFACDWHRLAVQAPRRTGASARRNHGPGRTPWSDASPRQGIVEPRPGSRSWLVRHSSRPSARGAGSRPPPPRPRGAARPPEGPAAPRPPSHRWSARRRTPRHGPAGPAPQPSARQVAVGLEGGRGALRRGWQPALSRRARPGRPGRAGCGAAARRRPVRRAPRGRGRRPGESGGGLVAPLACAARSRRDRHQQHRGGCRHGGPRGPPGRPPPAGHRAARPGRAGGAPCGRRPWRARTRRTPSPPTGATSPGGTGLGQAGCRARPRALPRSRRRARGRRDRSRRNTRRGRGRGRRRAPPEPTTPTAGRVDGRRPPAVDQPAYVK